MTLEKQLDGVFTFQGFAEHFPDGDDSDKPEFVSQNSIDCGSSKVQFLFTRKKGKLGGRLQRCDKGVLPAKVKCMLQVQGSSQKNALECTFVAQWCKSAWAGVDMKIMDADRITAGNWGWADFPIAMSALREAVDLNGALIMQATMTIFCTSSLTLSGHESCLRDNLEDLAADLIGSPVVGLEGPDGMRLELPKAVLSAHSAVLRAALDSDMQEGQSQTIQVVDVQKQALHDFAVCLCSGGLPSVVVTSWERLVDLFVVADKYDVRALVDACISLLATAICEGTVAPLMKIADAGGFTELLRCLLYYCLASSKRMNIIIDSDEYTHFSAGLLRNIAAHQELMESDRFLKYPESFQYLQVEKEINDEIDFSTLSTSKLRRACFERDLSASGTPAEIVARLSKSKDPLLGEPAHKRQRCE